MARPKAADHDLHRDRILAAAVHAFAEHGYPSASMSQLAKACGLSKAGLYHYYASKDALLFDALDRYTHRLVERCADAAARPLPPRESVARLVRTLLHEYRDSRDYHVALLNDLRHLQGPEQDRIRSQQRAVVRILTTALARAWPARMSGLDASATTMALLGMINFSFAWWRPDGSMSQERFADLVIDLWEHGLDGGQHVAMRTGT